jgi:hypothetical protein
LNAGHSLPKPHALAVASKALQATNQVSENKSLSQFPFRHRHKIAANFKRFYKEWRKKSPFSNIPTD